MSDGGKVLIWWCVLDPCLGVSILSLTASHNNVFVHSSTNIIHTIQYNTNMVVFIFVLKKNEINNIKKAIEIG